MQVVAAEEARGTVKRVCLLDVAVDEHVLPRDEGVIEEEHRVILVKARGKRQHDRGRRQLFSEVIFFIIALHHACENLILSPETRIHLREDINDFHLLLRAR